MKTGILLLLVGFILIVLFSKIGLNKQFFKKAGVVLGVFFIIYGIILMVQPKEDSYIKFTKTTKSQKSHIDQSYKTTKNHQENLKNQ